MEYLKNFQYDIKTPTGWKSFKGVKYNGKKKLYKLSTESSTVTSTLSHKFLKDGKKTPLSKLKIGEKIDCKEKQEIITSIKFDRKDKCYDIIGVDNGVFLVNSIIYSSNCDELAFVPKNQADDFWSANYPTISASKESRVIVISTPNGLYNLFHNLYTGGETGRNTFKIFKSTWRDVPGRDKSWEAESRKNLGVVKFNQEYECNFIGSSQTLIEASVLENLAMTYIEPLLFELDDCFRVYERPQPNALYVIGADVATGSGGDYSTCQVLKIISTDPLKVEQVAVYENNTIDTYTFGDIVSRIGTYYNGAYIMLEANAEGAVTANRIWWGNEYENLYNDTNKSLGIKANRKTKVKAAMLMKKVIEDGSIKLVDQMTIAQLADYIDKKGKLGGKNLNDDLVSGLYWACYFFDSKILKIILNPNKKVISKSDNIFGVITDEMCSSWDNIEDGRAVLIESF